MARILIFGLVAVYLLAFAAVWANRKAFIYPLDPSAVTPAQAGVPDFKVHALTAPDGVEVIAWVSPPAEGSATIVYFHGNAGHLGHRAYRLEALAKAGYGVIALAYRGSAGAGGAPSEAAISSDAVQLVEAARAGTFGWTPDKLVYYGESLGSGVVTKLAIDQAPDGLILEAPFTAVVDRAAEQFWYFPVRLVLEERWESITYVPKIAAPLLILHGAQDPVTPLYHGQAVFDAAGSQQKTLLALEDTGHDVWTVEGKAAIFEFLASLN